MDPLNASPIREAIVKADQAVEKARLAYSATVDYLQQVLERFGEESEEYRAADMLCQAAHALSEGAETAVKDLKAARPDGPVLMLTHDEVVAAMDFEGIPLPPGTFIADGTNPWIEVDGQPLAWPQLDVPVAQDNDCDQCGDEPVPGVLTGMDDAQGIQRCDTCNRYAGDLDAALALAQLVGGVVKFEPDSTEPVEQQ
ncbi:MAG TPA: hypothetical protein VGL36_35585 [Kribbella sp.]